MTIGARSAIFFPLVLLTMLALLTFWISKAVQTPKPKIDGSSRHDPDYIMSNFVTTQTDINGALRYKLAAVEMTHFPDDDTTNLQRPRYTQFAVGKPYTQVEGLRGYVSSNGEKVELVDRVKITRQAFAGKDEMTIETDYLKILPNEDIVSTDSPVVIRQAPKTVIYATGMIYEKNKNNVTLLHKVRAHYEKPSIRAKVNKPEAKLTQRNQAAVSASSAKSTVKANKLQTKPQESNTTSNARIRRRYE